MVMLLRSCRPALIETSISVRVKTVGNVISGVRITVASDSEEYVGSWIAGLSYSGASEWVPESVSVDLLTRGCYVPGNASASFSGSSRPDFRHEVSERRP